MKKTVNGKEVELTSEEVAEVEACEAEWAAGAGSRQAQTDIEALEASVTQRRYRNAMLTEDGKTWLQDIETQIAALREKL